MLRLLISHSSVLSNIIFLENRNKISAKYAILVFSTSSFKKIQLKRKSAEQLCLFEKQNRRKIIEKKDFDHIFCTIWPFHFNTKAKIKECDHFTVSGSFNFRHLPIQFSFCVTCSPASLLHSLFQGPPGTGKTQTILGLLSAVLHSSPAAVQSK